ALLAADERAQPRVAAQHVAGVQLGVEGDPGAFEQEVHLLAGAVHVVGGAGVVGVGGADHDDVAPAGAGGPPRAARDRHGDRPVVAYLRPGQHDVHALARAALRLVAVVGHAFHPVGPHAGRVDHDAGADVDLLAVGLDRRAGDPSARGAQAGHLGT